MAIVDKINAFTGEHSETIEDSLKNLSEIKKLPEVTVEDNGKVLSVVEGEWAKADASGGGGGVAIIRYDSNYEDNLYEVATAYWKSGKLPVVEYVTSYTSDREPFSVRYLPMLQGGADGADNIIFGGLQNVFSTTTASIWIMEAERAGYVYTYKYKFSVTLNN